MKIGWRFEKRRLTENEEKVKRKEINQNCTQSGKCFGCLKPLKCNHVLNKCMQAEGEVCNLTQLQES